MSLNIVRDSMGSQQQHKVPNYIRLVASLYVHPGSGLYGSVKRRTCCHVSLWQWKEDLSQGKELMHESH